MKSTKGTTNQADPINMKRLSSQKYRHKYRPAHPLRFRAEKVRKERPTLGLARRRLTVASHQNSIDPALEITVHQHGHQPDDAGQDNGS